VPCLISPYPLRSVYTYCGDHTVPCLISPYPLRSVYTYCGDHTVPCLISLYPLHSVYTYCGARTAPCLIRLCIVSSPCTLKTHCKCTYSNNVCVMYKCALSNPMILYAQFLCIFVSWRNGLLMVHIKAETSSQESNTITKQVLCVTVTTDTYL